MQNIGCLKLTTHQKLNHSEIIIKMYYDFNEVDKIDRQFQQEKSIYQIKLPILSSQAILKYTDPQPEEQWVKKFKGELDVGQEVSQTMSIDHQTKPVDGSMSDLQEQEEDDESPNQSKNEEAEGEQNQSRNEEAEDE